MAVRVKPDRRVGLDGKFEKRTELRRIKRLVGRVGVELDAHGAQLIDCAVHLLKSRIRIVHGQACDECRKPARVLRHQFSESVVGNLCHIGRLVGAREDLHGWAGE